MQLPDALPSAQPPEGPEGAAGLAGMEDQEDPSQEAQLEDGEEYASPEEQHALEKVMVLVYHSLSEGMHSIEGKLVKGSKNLAQTVGQLTFTALLNVYQSARQAGQNLSPDIFLMQGGAVYETIEAVLQIAEHAGIPGADDDKIREDSLGVVMDLIQAHKGEFGPQQSGPAQGPPPPPMMAAKRLPASIQQGLASGGMPDNMRNLLDGLGTGESDEGEDQ